MASDAWALSYIEKLLPLDEDSLKQIIDYSNSLSKEAAAEHLKNLLGDSPLALEFISSFNSRRQTPPKATPAQVSNGPSKQRRKKAPLNKLPPPRQPENYGNTQGAYRRQELEDYVPGSGKTAPAATTFSLNENPQPPKSASATSSHNPSPKPPPSAAGTLISDLPNVRMNTSAPKAKIALSGGMPMHGASSTLNDLDSAIRALEIQTNPSLSSNATDTSARRCSCQATRHPLLAAAPNCLNCGKIICVREGIGPCTFCSHPLLSSSDIQSMVQSLKEERGREKMSANNASQRRPVSHAPRPFQPASSSKNTPDSTLASARAHRDKLLTYQSQNARRTHIIDEAADFETPTAGLTMWGSAVERAQQLKRQQKVLREQEWSAKPEWEKRRVVVSVDLVKGKVIRRMGEVEREKPADEFEEIVAEQDGEPGASGAEVRGVGTFGRNPLMGALIRPLWKARDREGGMDEEDGKENRAREPLWRRVQDEADDNEGWILDGGVYGGREDERHVGEEPGCG